MPQSESMALPFVSSSTLYVALLSNLHTAKGKITDVQCSSPHLSLLDRGQSSSSESPYPSNPSREALTSASGAAGSGSVLATLFFPSSATLSLQCHKDCVDQHLECWIYCVQTITRQKKSVRMFSRLPKGTSTLCLTRFRLQTLNTVQRLGDDVFDPIR